MRTLAAVALLLVLPLLPAACGTSPTDRCGPSPCAACVAGTRADHQCVGNQWQCRCAPVTDCGASPCGACPSGTSPADECVDGGWQCICR